MATKKSTKEPVQVQSPVTHLRSTPIGEYGFLSDGEVSALLSPAGSVEWMCVPRFDSPSVFGSMLGRHAGSCRIGPDDITVPADVRYLPGTMILETSWGTPTGWIIVRDALLVGPWRPRGMTGPRPTNGHRTTTRPSTSCCGPSAAHPAKYRPSWTASPSSTTGAPGPTGPTPVTATTRVLATAEGTGPQADLDQRPADRVRGRPGQRADAAQGG